MEKIIGYKYLDFLNLLKEEMNFIAPFDIALISCEHFGKRNIEIYKKGEEFRYQNNKDSKSLILNLESFSNSFKIKNVSSDKSIAITLTYNILFPMQSINYFERFIKEGFCSVINEELQNEFDIFFEKQMDNNETISNMESSFLNKYYKKILVKTGVSISDVKIDFCKSSSGDFNIGMWF